MSIRLKESNHSLFNGGLIYLCTLIVLPDLCLHEREAKETCDWSLSGHRRR